MLMAPTALHYDQQKFKFTLHFLHKGKESGVKISHKFQGLLRPLFLKIEDPELFSGPDLVFLIYLKHHIWNEPTFARAIWDLIKF